LSQAKKAKIELTFEGKRGNSAAKAIITKSDLIDTTILYSVYRAINKKTNQECYRIFSDTFGTISYSEILDDKCFFCFYQFY
jgi:hypothetical protein